MTTVCRTDDAHRHAREIAARDPYSAAPAVADAIVRCKDHRIAVEWQSGDFGRIVLAFRNWFGPTCGVDDVLERMTMREWKLVCRGVLSIIRYGEVRDMEMNVCPHVTFIPESDTDIITEVWLRFAVPREIADEVVTWVDAEREARHGGRG